MQAEEYKQLVTLCEQVAFFLNVGEKTPVWEAKPAGDEPYPTHYIRKTDNHECELSVRIETYGAKKGYVEIGGNFHLRTNKDGNRAEFFDVREWIGSERSALPGISVNASRGAEVIAKEIKRRFLPEYLPLFIKAVARRDGQNSYRDKQVAVMRELAAVLSKTMPEDRVSRAIKDDRDTFSFYSDSKGYGDVQCYENSVNLKLSSVSVDKAKRILTIMAE